MAGIRAPLDVAPPKGERVSGAPFPSPIVDGSDFLGAQSGQAVEIAVIRVEPEIRTEWLAELRLNGRAGTSHPARDGEQTSDYP